MWQLVILLILAGGHAFMNELQYQCTCLAARDQYLLAHPVVAFQKLDPLIHYQNVGKRIGYAWACDLCCSAPRYIEEPFCNCSAAIDQFLVDYPETASRIQPREAFVTYFHNSNQKLSWNCSLCETPKFEGTIPSWCPGSTTLVIPPLKLQSKAKPRLLSKPQLDTQNTSHLLTSRTGTLPSNCVCLKARFDYWNRYFAVYSANLDPVVHFQMLGAQQGNTWNCSLCAENPRFIDNSTTCNCTSATDRFFLDYPYIQNEWKVSRAQAFETFLSKYMRLTAWNETLCWHCELCTGESPIVYPFPLAFEQTCLVARGMYLAMYTSVARNRYDPVGYYMLEGGGKYPWPTGRCGYSDIYVQDTEICNCSTAIIQFQTDFTHFLQSVPALAYRFYLTYFTIQINVNWHCELCLTVNGTKTTTTTTTAITTTSMTTSNNQATTGPNSSGPSPSTSSTGSSSGYSTTTVPTSTGSSSILFPLSDHCKCLDARYSYWSLHPDVYNDNIDPVYHYQNIGGGLSDYLWRCDLCTVKSLYINDQVCNCTHASTDFQSFYHLPARIDPFSYYLEQHARNGPDAWHCELCRLTSDSNPNQPRDKNMVVVVVIAVLVPSLVVIGVFAYIYKQKRKVLKEMVLLGERKAYVIDLNDVIIGKLIGAGSFGYVYQDVAIKKLKHQNMTRQQLADFVNEATIRLTLQDIVLFMGVCVAQPDLCIVTEFMPRGSLYEVIHDGAIKLTLPLILSIAIDALKGLQYIHSAGILHRDLKSPNLLVDNKWTIKIADFGLSCAKNATSDDVEISLLWTAPEILVRQKNCYSEKSDLYSFGIILWELMSRRTPFDEYLPAAIAPAIVAGQRPPVDPGWIEAVQTAMQGCWRQTPAMRSNLQEVRTLLDTARSAYIYALTPSPMRGAARRSNASSSSDSPRLDIDESMYDPPSDAYNTNLHRYVQLADLPRTPRVHTNAARSGEPDFDNPLDSPPLTPTLWPEQRLAPLGIVTFVFTDVQGSSVLWEADPRMMVAALKLHNKICTDLLAELEGYEVKTDGDAFMYAFSDSFNAVNFCMRTQLELLRAPWPQKLLDIPGCEPVHNEEGYVCYRGLSVRMGIHVGEPLHTQDPVALRMDYYGPVVMTAARISAYANGGQILINPDMYVKIVAGVSRLDPFLIETIGRCMVKGIKEPVNLYQIVPAALKYRLKAPVMPSDDDSNSFLRAKTDRKLPAIDPGREDPEYVSSLSLSSPFLSSPLLQASSVSKDQSFLTSFAWNPSHHEKWIIDFDELEMGRRLGVGTYGDVHSATWRGKKVAVKKFLRQHVGENALLEMRMEGGILSSLDHPNILNFKGMCIKIPNLCIVTEILTRGSLSTILYSQESLPWKLRIQFAIDIASGLQYLHMHNIIHRDVKSPNMLVGADWSVKIGDFGFSRIKVEHTTMTQCGTVAWTAPEIFSGSHYSEKADIYSFGVILWELIYRKKPWDGLNAMRIINEVEQGHRPPTNYIPTDTPPHYTLTDVSKHKSKDDLWFVIHGKVYDVTKFADDHPGGGQALVDEAGTDATNAFEDIGHSQDARDMLAPYYVGDLEVAPVIPSSFPSAQVPPSPKKEPLTPEPTSTAYPSSTASASTSSPSSPISSSTSSLFDNAVVRAIVLVGVPLALLFVYQRFSKQY